MAKAGAPRIARGAEDLKEMLKEQVQLLQLACASYDAGALAAAKHLSVGLRVLLHDTPASHSLLDQLGLRSRRFSEWNFSVMPRTRDGKMYRPPRDDLRLEMDVIVGSGDNAQPMSVDVAIGAECRLALCLTTKGKAAYIAPLSSSGVEIRKKFPHWWNDEVVRDRKGNTLSRKQLVLNVANTDGGAHVDEKLDAVYLAFSRKNALEWKFRVGRDDWQAIPGPHLPSIRQIAHEVLMTMQRTAPWVFGERYSFPKPLGNQPGFSLGSLGIKFVEKKVGR
jgi:hypothetical protein